VDALLHLLEETPEEFHAEVEELSSSDINSFLSETGAPVCQF